MVSVSVVFVVLFVVLNPSFIVRGFSVLAVPTKAEKLMSLEMVSCLDANCLGV